MPRDKTQKKMPKAPLSEEEKLGQQLTRLINAKIEEMCASMGRSSVEEKEAINDMLATDPELHSRWKETMASIHLNPDDKQLGDFTFILDMQDSGNLDRLNLSHDPSSKSIRPGQVRDAIVDIDQYTDSVRKHLESLQAHMTRNTAAIKSGGVFIDKQIGLREAEERALQEKKTRLQGLTRTLEESIEKQEGLLGHLQRESNSELLEMLGMDRMSGQPFQKPEQKMGVVQPRSTGERLLSYDDLLDKLGALGRELKGPNVEQDAIIKAARFYASEEVFILVCACRMSLNKVLYESCLKFSSTAPTIGERARALQSEVLALVDEIQSLWDEVVPVAHMAVEKQVLEPLLTRIDKDKGREDVHRRVVLQYVHTCLCYMNERLRALAERLCVAIQHHHSLFTAYEYAREASETMLSSKTPAGKHSDTHQVAERNGKGHPKGALATLEKYMKDYAFLPPTALFDPPSSPAIQAAKLDDIVRQRTAKGDTALESVHHLFESVVKDRLEDTEVGSRTLFECVATDSRAQKGIRGSALEDGPTEDSISALKGEADEVEANLKDIDERLAWKDTFPNSFMPLLEHSRDIIKRESSGRGRDKHSDGGHILVDQDLQFVRRWGDPQFRASQQNG